MEPRHASVAVIGAGDYIGAAIARRFAREDFAVVCGRRNGAKLGPLIAEIEALGGTCTGRGLDARDEADIAAFLNEAEALAPLEATVFNVGATASMRGGIGYAAFAEAYWQLHLQSRDGWTHEMDLRPYGESW